MERGLEFNEAQKQMEEFIKEQLKIGKDAFLSTLQNLPSGIIFIDRNYEVAMANSNAFEFFGSKNVSEFALGFINNFPKYQGDGVNSIQKYKQVVDEAFEKGSVATDWLCFNQYGDLAILDVTLTKIENDEQGQNEEYLLVCVKDITPYISQNQFTDTFLAIVDASPLALNLWDENFKNVMCNKKVLEMFELSSKEDYLKNFFKFSPKYQPDGSLSKDMSAIHFELAKNVGRHKFKWMHQNLKGEEIPSEITLSKIKTFGNREYIVGFIRDLRQEFSYKSIDLDDEYYFMDIIPEKTLLTKVAELTQEWFFAYDTRTKKISFYGESARKNSTKFELEELLKFGVIHPDDIEKYNKLAWNLENDVYEPIDIRYLREDGTFNYFRWVYKSVYNKENVRVFVVGKGLDIHDQKMLEERSKLDLLTGCYNKFSAESLITEKLTDNEGKQGVIFTVDLDNFGVVNDKFGHFFGDEIIEDASQNLKNCFRDQDIIGRVGGDQFIVYVENINSMELIQRKAQAILKNIDKTYKLNGDEFRITASVGVAMITDDENDFEKLRQSADRALNSAKSLGKNEYVIFNESISKGTVKNLAKIESSEKMMGNNLDHELISAVFNLLYERNGDASAINSVMRFICHRFGVDRSYIYETFDGAKTYKNTFEFRLTESEKVESLDNIPVEKLREIFGDGTNNGVFFVNDLTYLAKQNKAYESVVNAGIKSFAQTHIRKDGEIAFILGVDMFSSARIWSEIEVNSLQYIAKIISIILQGNHLRSEIKELTEYNKVSAYVADNTDDMVYIVDADNYDVLYLNRAAINLLGNPSDEEWKNEKCHKLLYGSDVPCSFCTNHLVNEHDFYEWTFKNPRFKKTYLMKEKIIKLKGRRAKLQISTDVTKLTSLERELKDRLEEQQLLVQGIRMLHSDDSPDDSIVKLLKLIASFYGADRASLFAVSADKTSFANTHEWFADGLKPRVEKLQAVPMSMAEKMFKAFAENNVFSIDSLGEKFDKKEQVSQVIGKVDTENLMACAIRDTKNEIIGFIGIENSELNFKKYLVLDSLSVFIADFLNKNELISMLNNLSYYDRLTGIKNRHSYRKALEEIEMLPLKSLGVAYVDVTSLSTINDAKGAAYGDEVIKRLANILSEFFGENVYRVGGDEFIVLELDMDEKCFESKIKDLKNRTFEQKDFSATIGYTWNKSFEHELSETTFNKNFSALSENKKYSSMLSGNLENEIQDGKYVVYLQPQIDFQTGEVEGAEALIRRIDANGAIQPPISFIPFYEKEGIISKIDLCVLDTVCKKLSELKAEGVGHQIKISVNCSRVTLIEDDIVQKFCDICSKYDVDRSHIIVEITETISGSCDNILSKIIASFSDAGFGISLDDFGSGYSNLSALKASDFDELKIDMSLTAEVHTDEKSKTLTNVALNICQELEDLVSVAEGIETKEQFDVLKEMGCHRGQGYYFDKPMPIDTFVNKFLITQ